MSTRCNIGILEPNGKIKAIYCHNNGSPQDTGKLLLEHYSDETIIKKLIALGNISCLQKRLAPNDNETHSFDNPLPDVTVAYIRDRNEDPLRNEATLYLSKADYIAHGDGTYLYLWDIHAQEWKCATYSSTHTTQFRSLTKMLTKIKGVPKS